MAIETDRDLDRMIQEVGKLMQKGEDRLSPEEGRLLETMAILIEQHEEKRYPLKPGAPQRMLKHLMEARGLRPKDLWGILGSKGVASEVIHGKRGISKAQAKALGAFFHVSPEVFL
jgi:HTH-type transcriptional regulator/antitoxin HigA